MSRRKTTLPLKAVKPTANRKRMRREEAEGFLSTVRKRSHEKANRRLRASASRSVWASMAIDDVPEYEAEPGLGTHFLRLVLGLVLLPLCWVTTWTFMRRFSHATLEQGFWQSAPFWYFTVGALVMTGWFFSKLGQRFFLYLYVFGHEFTHAAFVKCFGGKVLDMAWSSEGGYVTTDKTNWVIALSPYFVPFWSVISVMMYVIAGFFYEVTVLGNLVFYGVIGATWAFHLVWTLWMIPRDQPDLKDNGTFLSLVLIYFGNLIVLVFLLCLACPSPFDSLKEFGTAWLSTAATWGDWLARWVGETGASLMR